LTLFCLHIIGSLMSIEIFMFYTESLFIRTDFRLKPILEFVFPACDHPAIIIYNGGRESERQSAANSSITAVPAHMTVSAPPQYIFTVPSSSGTAPQVKTTLGT